MLNEVNDLNFEDEVIKQNGTVLVEYYSNSCMPCKRLLPKLENVASRQLSGKIVKVNVETNFESSMRNMVRTIPTIVVYKNGEVVDAFRGCSQMSEEDIASLIDA